MTLDTSLPITTILPDATALRATDGGWALLPTLVVRSAGFPWAVVDALAHHRAGSLADRLGAALEDADAVRSAVPRGVRLSRGQASCLRNYRPIPAAAVVPDDWRARWDGAAEAVSSAREAWLAALADDDRAADDAVAALVADPRFREAVVCSSPAVHRDLSRPGPAAARLRRQVASYAQRVATKCETMSFFGPINYAELLPGQEAPAVLGWPGPQSLAGRRAYLAAWAFERLLDAVLAQPGVAADLVPHRTTFAHVGDRDPQVAALGGAADGRRRLAELAAGTGLELHQATAALRRAQSRGVLTHDLVPPAVEPDQTRWLAAQLGPGPAADLVAAVVAVLDRYPAADADTKLELQGALHRLLPEGTGPQDTHGAGPDGTAGTDAATGPAAAAPISGAGPRRDDRAARPQFYNDRVVVTEAAAGTLHLTLGGGLAADLQSAVPSALDLLAHSAVLTRRRVNRALAGALGPGLFPLMTVLRRAAALAVDPDPWLADTLAAAIRDAGSDAEDVDLAGSVPVPPLPDLPVLCSVDVLVVSDDLARYRPGETLLVIGDVHDAPLLTPWALQFHPDAEQALAGRDRAIERCLGPHRAVSVVARRRTALPPLRFPGPVVELGRLDGPAERLPLDLLAVHSDGERAELRMPGAPGRPGAELLLHNGELDTGVHTALALPRVRPPRLPAADHVPRLRYGNVVLARRRWRLLPGLLTELPAAPATAPERLALSRALARAGLPRRFFAKASHQRKPIYVDVDSPLLVDALYRLASKAEQVHASEVLPGGDASWLRPGAARPGDDPAAGAAFAAELRCVYLRPAGAPALPNARRGGQE